MEILLTDIHYLVNWLVLLTALLWDKWSGAESLGEEPLSKSHGCFLNTRLHLQVTQVCNYSFTSR